ncbi:MAG: hypothetical protein EOS26_08015, partial [Mesorhizobium sp.]
MDEVSAKSSLGKVVAYTLAHWHGLTAFLTDGRIEVHSNVVERSLKPVCLTRKNSIFCRIRPRWRDLGGAGITGQLGTAQWSPSRNLARRRARADRLGCHSRQGLDE